LGPLASARILLVDDDVALLGLLQSLLEEAGCAVDTVAGLEGFTPDLMALSRPNIVFLNPHLRGLEAEGVRLRVRAFRKLQPRATVIVIGAGAQAQLQADAAAFEADGFIPTAHLLRNPVGGVPTQALPPAPPPSAERAKVAELEPEEILDLELEVLEAPPAKLQTKPAPPAGTFLGEELVKVIEEEVLAPHELEVVEHFEVALDVLNENNLYGPSVKYVTGIYVAASARPKVGVPVELAVTFPWGSRCEVVGTVEWAKDLPRASRRARGGFGVKLPELPASQRAMFDRFASLRQPMLFGG
jgi:CheY-like chemotaxis protein